MLIKSTAEIQKYFSVGNATNFDNVKPHILNAETACLSPLFGSNLLKQLQDFYDAPPTGSGSAEVNVAELTELLAKVQKSIVHLAYWMGFQVLNATISDSGFKRTESEKQKSLYKYQETELKEYFKNAGFNALDEALEYLEVNVDKFDDFDMTPAWAVFKTAFIPKTRTFDTIISINNSRLTFLRLKPEMQVIEDMEIYPILGAEIYAYVKAELAKDVPDPKVKALLPYIQKPVAYLSSAMLMEESGADLTEKGLYFEATKATFNNDTEKTPASDNRIAILVARNRQLGNAYLDQLKSYLKANEPDWPDYSGQTGSVLRRDNNGKKTFWA